MKEMNILPYLVQTLAGALAVVIVLGSVPFIVNAGAEAVFKWRGVIAKVLLAATLVGALSVGYNTQVKDQLKSEILTINYETGDALAVLVPVLELPSLNGQHKFTLLSLSSHKEPVTVSMAIDCNDRVLYYLDVPT